LTDEFFGSILILKTGLGLVFVASASILWLGVPRRQPHRRQA